MVLPAVAVAALHVFHLAGGWRSALAALYLNVFVGVTQLAKLRGSQREVVHTPVRVAGLP